MSSDFLKNVWYMGLTSLELKKNQMLSRVIIKEPIVFFRDSKNNVHALKDICPHRGIPFSFGRVVKDQIECPYHGWKFDCTGMCTEIPSLVPGQELDPNKIKVRSYPTKEIQGMIWVYITDKNNFDINLAPEIPFMNRLPKDVNPQVLEKAEFNCHIDHAVIGLMDPAHGPYIHKSWLWRNEKSTLVKKKKFTPVNWGFQMVRHQPSANSKAYKVFGETRSTEITFTLPSVRVEHITFGKYNFYSYSALTPVDDQHTQIHQMLYWDARWLNLFTLALKKFAHFFLWQDVDAVNKQQVGLRFDPTLMLIKDADQMAKWYFSLKQEWMNHQIENRFFVNPVKEVELSWRS